MACGVHLGFLLICLVQAEHVCCSWATQAQRSQRQNGNQYVGFSQQDSGLRLGGSYPQNQLRQASVSPGSAQSSSLNTETAVSGGYSQGLSSSGYTQTHSQPAQGGYSSVKLVQSNLLSKPDWRLAKSDQLSMQKVPRKQIYGLSTSIASGSSLSKNQNDNTDISKKRTWPTQQGTPRASSYRSSSSAFVQSPSESYSKSAYHQSAAQMAPRAAAETPAYHGPRGSSSVVKSSRLFSAGAPAPQSPARMQTSARVPGKRVSSRRSSEASPRSSFSSQNGRTNNPSQAEAVNPYQSRLFAVNGGNAQGSYKPTSMAHNQESYSQSLPASNKRYAPVGFQPRSVEKPISQRSSSLQATWSSRNSAQGAGNLPASQSGRAGTSARRYAPTRTHRIPQRYGGSAIRRLKEPVDQSVKKPQQTYTATSRQTASYPPQVQSVHQESKWKRIRKHQGY